jgi:drug/metabolite transporter (DMT)-like permease
VIDRAYLLLPLGAAMLYAVAATLLKLAYARGTRVTRAVVLANLTTCIAFSAFYPWDRLGALPGAWLPCLAVGATFVLGQLLTILAFSWGDVSIASTALGSKVFLVALLASAFTSHVIGIRTWLAAAGMTLALVLLTGRPRKVDLRHTLGALIPALLSALSFAGFDLLIQHYSPDLTFGLLAPFGMAVALLLSLPLLLIDRATPPKPDPGRVRLLLAGSILLTGQAMLLIWSIGIFQDAPGANVVYATRGIWSVLLVAALGKWMAQVEHMTSRSVVIRRLIAAVVMAVAVAIMFV